MLRPPEEEQDAGGICVWGAGAGVGGRGKPWWREGDGDRVSPVWRRLLSGSKPTSQPHRMKTRAASRRRELGSP